ncbi:FkbM family methyltransferase [Marinobacter oulmenensis]|uniref:FkbM family methyltransferase n=2 Tax=Marinobacter oulmenensis TaxID=643747 RepID=A0A840U9T5_9GAMM|nr:FkbM family methyltransferase [Marinobacter oulmenensis]
MKRKLINLATKFKNHLRISVNEIQVNFDTRHYISKNWFYPRYFGGRPHEPCISRLFCDEIEKDYVVFDIGANQGYFTVLSSQLLDSRGAVHAFELDPVLIPLAQSSLKLNSYECSVYFIQCAVSDKDGDLLSFIPHIDGNPTTNSILYENNSNTKTISQTISIDSYCRRLSIAPDFIKLDVEGAERLALVGLEETIKRCKPKLLLEIHPKQLREAKVDVESVAKLLMRWTPDYNVYLVEDYREEKDNYLKEISLTEITYGERPVVLYFRVD